MTVPYVTRLRLALADARERRLPFEQAWEAALKTAGAPQGEDGWAPHVVKFAKRAFCEAYHGRAVLGRASILVERDATMGPAPERREHAPRCAWGGGCPDPPLAGGRFCEPHRDALRAACPPEALEGKNYRTVISGQHARDLEPCITPGCERYAQRGRDLCGGCDVTARAA